MFPDVLGPSSLLLQDTIETLTSIVSTNDFNTFFIIFKFSLLIDYKNIIKF
jgi:hypothetical protein